MKRPIEMFAVLAVILTLVAPLVYADDQEDLLRTVLDRNESAFQKIKSVTYVSKTEVHERRKGERPYDDNIVRKYVRDGERVRLFQTRTVLPEQDGKKLPPQRVDDRTIIADSFMAHFQKVIDPPQHYAAPAMWWGHESIAGMSKESKDYAAFSLEEDEVMLAFGPSSWGTTYRDFVAAGSPGTRFDMAKVEGKDGRVVYQLRRYFRNAKPPGERLLATWEFDPESDYLMVHSVSYSQQGPVTRDDRLTPEAIGTDRIFLPTKLERTMTLRDASHHHTKVLTDVVVNSEIDSSVFNFDQLEVPEGTSVLKRDSEGNEESCVFQKGAIVPRPLPRQQPSPTK